MSVWYERFLASQRRTCRLPVGDRSVRVGAVCDRPLSHYRVVGVDWSGFTDPGLMLVGHGCTRLVLRGVVFGSILIEGLEVEVIPILFLVQ